MKLSVFSALTFSIFLMASCQNTPGAASDGSTSGAVVESIAMSSDPNKLNEQILTDFLNAQKESKQYAQVYDESFNVIKTMKMAWASKDDAGKAKIKQLVDEAMQFRLSYEAYLKGATQLDSLSTQLGAGSIQVEEAQKIYSSIRAEMIPAGSRLSTEQGNVQNSKQQFEQAFPAGN